MSAVGSRLGAIALAVCAAAACRAGAPTDGGARLERLEPDSLDTAAPVPVAAARDAGSEVDANVESGPIAAHDVAEALPEADAKSAGRPGYPSECINDSDCEWNDPCVPTFCASPGVALGEECDKSLPPPGRCRCINLRCTLQRFDPSGGDSPDAGCHEGESCWVNLAAGRCRAGFGSGGDDGFDLALEGGQGGADCRCEREGGRCTWHWVEPVPCTTHEQCGIGCSDGRMRPIRARPGHQHDVPDCVVGEYYVDCDWKPGPLYCTIFDGEVP